jgi:hypothetical protein
LAVANTQQLIYLKSVKPMSMSKPNHKRTNFLSVVKSILAAGIGVQSEKNRQRDFEKGNPLVFIIGGIIFTVLFILTVASVVGLVLSNQ